jgi:hypothetical protein
MSFREKSAWVSTLSMSCIYAFYFWSVIHSESLTSGVHFGGMLVTVIALVVVQVVLTIAVAIFAPKEADAPPDERDSADRTQGHPCCLCLALRRHSVRVLLRCLHSADLQYECATVRSGYGRARAVRMSDCPVRA